MEMLLIIVAIVVAVLLLSGSIVPPRRPSFRISDKISNLGLLYKMSVLGARSTVVERGNGVNVRKTFRQLKHSVNAVKKKLNVGEGLEYWERVLLDNSEVILCALKNAMRDLRFGYTLGHVASVPRIFSFCEELVRSTGGQIDRNLLIESLKTFSSGVELSYGELKYLNSFLVYCLCGYISTWVTVAEKRQKAFDHGLSDGKRGRLDLDSVRQNDYICGLFFGCSSDDVTSFERIAEVNGTDCAAAQKNRRLFLARVFAAIEQSSESLKKIESVDGFLFDFSKANSVLAGDTHYSESKIEIKLKYLSYVRAYAKTNGISEESAAEELIKNLSSAELYDKVFKTKRAAAISISVNILPIVFVGLTMWKLIAQRAVIVAAFCVLSVFTVYCGGVKLLYTVFDERMKPAKRVFDGSKYKRFVTACTALRGYIILLTPLAEVIAILLCSYAFSYSALFVACAVFISEILSCIYTAAYEFSFAPLNGMVKAFRRFLLTSTAPLDLAISVFAKHNSRFFISEKNYKIASFYFGFIVGVTVVIFSAIASGSVIMLILGAFIVISTVDEQIRRFLLSLRSKLSILRMKKNTDGKSVAVHGSIIPSARFFGGETNYKANTVLSDDVIVSADNFGEINAKFYLDDQPKIACNIDFILTDGTKHINLEACHGAFEKHRTVYKYADEYLELSVEAIAAIDISSCLCRVTVCNRTDDERTVKLCVRCKSDDILFEKNISVQNNGVIATGDYALGVFFANRNAETSADGRLQLNCDVRLCAMAKTVTIVPIIAAKSASSVNHAAMQVDGNYFDYALSGANGYNNTELAHNRNWDMATNNATSRLRLRSAYSEAGTDAFLTEKSVSDDIAFFSRRVSENPPIVDDVDIKLPDVEYDVVLSCGGFTESGAVGVSSDRVNALSGNTLCDGESRVQIDDSGKTAFACKKPNGTIEVSDAFIAINESAVWSPTNFPIGAGTRQCIHEKGYSRFICSYNKALCTLKIFHAAEKCALFFDLEIENRANEKRTFDVMCSFVPASVMLPIKMTRRGKIITLFSKSDGTGVAVLSSRDICDYTMYKEGYNLYGKIDRASGFRTGGDAVAPSASSQIQVEGGRSERVIFCIAAKTDELKLDCIDDAVADCIFKSEVEKYGKLSAVSLFSSDKELNHVFSASCVRAYSLGMSEQMSGGLNTYGLNSDRLLSLFKIYDGDRKKVGADILLCAAARYKMRDYSAAYKSIDMFVKKLIGGEIFPDGITYSLFCTLITEKLLGLKLDGDKAKISPSTSDNTPHLEFDIMTEQGKSHIVISDSKNDGSWYIKIGRITYLSDTILLGENDLPIILDRLENH